MIFKETQTQDRTIMTLSKKDQAVYDNQRIEFMFKKKKKNTHSKKGKIKTLFLALQSAEASALH